MSASFAALILFLKSASMAQSATLSTNLVTNAQPPEYQLSVGKLLSVRVILDTLLVWGALLLIFGMAGPALKHWSSLYFSWAVTGLVSCVLIFGITFKKVNQATRRITSGLLAVLLLSLALLNVQFFWLAPEVLVLHYQIQIMIQVITAWALVCLGLICIETRIENSLANPSNLKTDFSMREMAYRFGAFSMLGFGAVALLYYPFLQGPVYFEQLASTAWPVTEAVLVEPEEGSKQWLNYSYSVGEQEYTGTREVSFMPSESQTSVHGATDLRLAELERQAAFPVAYNPSQPEQSLLEPGVSNLMLFSIWACCIYPLFIPIQLKFLKGVYSGAKSLQEELTKFESVTASMALAGLAANVVWYPLTVWVPLPVDWVAILLISAIGVVYYFHKKPATAASIDVGRTEPTG